MKNFRAPLTFVRGACGTMEMIDLRKEIRSIGDLTEEEKGLLRIVLLLPHFILTVLFILAPFILD